MDISFFKKIFLPLLLIGLMGIFVSCGDSSSSSGTAVAPSIIPTVDASCGGSNCINE